MITFFSDRLGVLEKTDPGDGKTKYIFFKSGPIVFFSGWAGLGWYGVYQTIHIKLLRSFLGT